MDGATTHRVKKERWRVNVDLQGGRLLPLSLQAPVFLLLDEGGRAGRGRRRKRGGRRVSGRIGGEPFAQRLPLVLDVRVLLHYHGLWAGEEELE